MTSPLNSLDQLSAAGLITPEDADRLDIVAQRYAIGVTSDVAAIIDASDPCDPIGAQFLPRLEELNVLDNERADPIDDAAYSPIKGLVHRYPDRVLLKLVSVCPVYCRFCFRREMVGPGGEGLTGPELDAAIDYIASRPEIFEVIMTGGDPFMLSPRRISDLTRRLAQIEHVKMVRWHTRVPVVDSARVTPELVEALRAPGLTTWVAIHANHAREFTPKACEAIARLSDGGVVLVSQSVLLKGINDNVGALKDLMRAFLVNRVKPYYLHHPDLAPGTSHFRNSIQEGRALMHQLRLATSGLAQPHYVLDVPDGAIKAPLGPSYFEQSDTNIAVMGNDGSWLDYKG